MTSAAKTVQVAVVQAGAIPFDSDACVAKAVRLIGEAAATGAKVIVFPEAFIQQSTELITRKMRICLRRPAGFGLRLHWPICREVTS